MYAQKRTVKNASGQQPGKYDFILAHVIQKVFKRHRRWDKETIYAISRMEARFIYLLSFFYDPIKKKQLKKKIGSL